MPADRAFTDMGNAGLFQRWIRFNGVGALGSGLQLALVAVLVRAAGVHYLWATAAGIEAAVLHNFCWHECWTWADRRTGHDCGWRRWLPIEIVPPHPDVQPDDLRTGRPAIPVSRHDLDPLDPPR